jgi:2-desacetyl-2-hydroxyethyl bacteriochlorophyllide A dehydrogenase
MQTVILNKPGAFELIDRPEPGSPSPGEALVRIARIGVCGTDYHAFRGRQPFFTYPRVLGHELGVEVLAVGAGVNGIAVGDRCAVEPYLNCGVCIACRNGKTNCCTQLKVLGVHVDGGMCTSLMVPARKLHPSSKLTLDQLALVETLGIGAHAVERAQVKKDEWVLVIGAGPIGLAAMQFVRAVGAKLIVMEPNASRADFCRQQFGIQHVISPIDNPVERLRHITAEEMPTAVFDATGNSQSMMGAFNLVAHGGRLIFIGLFTGDVTFHDPDFHRRELTLLASRNALGADFRRIIEWIEVGVVDTTPWITHRAPLAQTPDIFATWAHPEAGVLKAMIDVA